MLFDKQYRDIRRTRKIFKTLKLPKQGRVIDISCGGGRLLKTIENHHPNLNLVGADITPGFLATHPELSKISFITAEASSIPCPDGTFDVSVCSLSLHHYKYIEEVLKEISRLTKNNGYIYLIDIFPSNNWSQKFYNLIKCHEPYHFEKFYTVAEIKQLIKPLGLNIINQFNISGTPRIVSLQLTKML